MQITFTLDLEDNWYSPDADRFARPARALLRATEERGIRGTVFVLGTLVERAPELIRDFAAAGHEIALHGWTHTPLPSLDAARLREEVRRGKGELERLVQRPVLGYRAPYFSLTAATRGAVAVLAEEGFRYSSSVLPARNPQFGWPECPAAAFRWPEGLVELPVPVARIRGRGLPFLGGVYLRVLPRAVVEGALRAVGRAQLLWTYCHPYDFDAEEPFLVIPRLGWAQSRLLWAGRRSMLRRLERLLARRTAPPLGERVAAGIATAAAAPA